MARLAAAQEKTDTRVGRLEEGQIRLEAALERTETRIGHLEESQIRLEAAQERTDARVGRLEEGQIRIEAGQRRTETGVAGLRGDSLERRYRDHAGGYFGRLLRRARVVGPDELDGLLDEGLVAGLLDQDGADDVRLADLVVRSRRSGDERETYLVIEVSGVVEPGDVERAARRTELLGRVRPVVAAVGGEEITSEARDLARTRSVWQLDDGRIEPPTAT